MDEKKAQNERMKLLDDLGIFPKPSDTQEEYLKNTSTQKNDHTPNEILKDVYGIHPSWVTVNFQNKGLRFWEAGCTWIDETGKSTIQLRKSFEKKEKLLSVYSKNEVLSHECVHVCRSPLQSEKFEECFAYFLSPHFSRSFFSKIRMFFGPLFSSTRETMAFLLLLLFTYLAFIANMFFENSVVEILSWGAMWASTCFFGFLMIKNIFRWKTFYQCAKSLQKMGAEYPYRLMIRMTDEEIERFAKESLEQNLFWIQKEIQTSFRWDFFVNRYMDQNLLASQMKFWQSRWATY